MVQHLVFKLFLEDLLRGPRHMVGAKGLEQLMQKKNWDITLIPLPIIH
jgi:hypothetical protein